MSRRQYVALGAAAVVVVLGISVGIFATNATRRAVPPTLTPTPTASPTATSTPKPTPTSTPRPTKVRHTPTPTPRPTSTTTLTPYPTWTPTPVPPTWTPVPTPVHAATLPSPQTKPYSPSTVAPAYSSSSPLATPCCRSFPAWMQHKWDTPSQLQIPAIGVNASVESIDLRDPGEREAPHSWWDVAWYNGGPLPGAPGVSFVFGHLDSTTGIAIFWHLRDLVPGNQIVVTYHQHPPVTFEVVDSQVYWDSEVPMNFLFGPNRYHLLALMTCAGIFHPGPGYDHRLIVLAKQIS